MSRFSKMRSRRAVIGTALAAAVLTGALVTDRVMAVQAGKRLNTRADCLLTTAESPHVSIRGVPFLTQVISGSLSDVRVTADRFERGGVTVGRVDGHLYGVGSGSGSLLSWDRDDGITAERIEAGVTVPFSGLTGALATGAPETPGPTEPAETPGRPGKEGTARANLQAISRIDGRNGLLVISTELRRRVMSVPVTVFARPRIDGRTLRLQPEHVEVLGRTLPATALLSRLDRQPKLDRELPALPYGLTYTGVDVTSNGLRIRVRATDVRIRSGTAGKSGNAGNGRTSC